MKKNLDFLERNFKEIQRKKKKKLFASNAINRIM